MTPTLTLDLLTPAGRIAARAYLDALDEEQQQMALQHSWPKRSPAAVPQVEVAMDADSPAETPAPETPPSAPEGDIGFPISEPRPVDVMNVSTLARAVDHMKRATVDPLPGRLPDVIPPWDLPPLPRMPDSALAAEEAVPEDTLGAAEVVSTETAVQIGTTPEPTPSPAASAPAPEAEEAPAELIPERKELPPAALPVEHLDAERPVDAELRAQILALREKGDAQIMIAAKLGLTAARVKTILAEDLSAKSEAPEIVITTPDPLPEVADKPRAAPELQDAVAPEEAGHHPEAPSEAAPLNPDRAWTDDLKSEVWALYQGGNQPALIADYLELRLKRVQTLIGNIKGGYIKKPAVKSAGTALVPAGSTAVAVASRPVAQDPQMVMKRREEMTEAERRKFVARSVYPDMQP